MPQPSRSETELESHHYAPRNSAVAFVACVSRSNGGSESLYLVYAAYVYSLQLYAESFGGRVAEAKVDVVSSKKGFNVAVSNIKRCEMIYEESGMCLPFAYQTGIECL